MKPQRVIALLGRRDEPTDAVEEYCHYLGEALATHNFALEIRRVPWDQHGWAASLEALRLEAESWQGTCVLLQYTALACSARGFPNRFLKIVRLLHRHGVRVIVVYHDAEPFGGTRLVDRVRRMTQLRTMRGSLAACDGAVLTVPAANLRWMDSQPDKARFIPVGANLPVLQGTSARRSVHELPTVAVFSITGGAAGDRETDDIVAIMKFAAAKIGKLRLRVFGRHAEVREHALREGLGSLDIKLDVAGVVDPGEVVQRLSSSDVLLFLRGAISSRRGSAIAGIACGLPVIALSGTETAAPITDAGVILLRGDLDRADLQRKAGEALARVLSDAAFRDELAERSRRAQDLYFSWRAIAKQYLEVLQPPTDQGPA